MKTIDKQKKIEKKFLRLFIKEKILPIETGQPEFTKEEVISNLKTFGFKVINESGNFLNLVFPRGWKKVLLSKEEPNWCYLVDNKNRKRIAIYYKYIGYMNEDKKIHKVSCFMNFIPRFRVQIFQTNVKNNEEVTNDSPITGFVYDSGNLIYHTEPKKLRVKYGDLSWNKEVSFWKRNIYDKCKVWLDEKYPDNENVLAYWDIE